MSLIKTNVRVVLWLLSAVCWIGMLVLFVRLYVDTHKEIKEDKGPLPKGYTQFIDIVLSPFWVCIMSAVPVYILHMLHIICTRHSHENWSHIVHCLLMFCSFLFVASGGISTFLGLAIAFGHDTVNMIIPVNGKKMQGVLGCELVCLLFYWIASSIWPLFNYKRNTQREYEELQESLTFR